MWLTCVFLFWPHLSREMWPSLHIILLLLENKQGQIQWQEDGERDVLWPHECAQAVCLNPVPSVLHSCLKQLWCSFVLHWQTHPLSHQIKDLTHTFIVCTREGWLILQSYCFSWVVRDWTELYCNYISIVF